MKSSFSNTSRFLMAVAIAASGIAGLGYAVGAAAQQTPQTVDKITFVSAYSPTPKGYPVFPFTDTKNYGSVELSSDGRWANPYYYTFNVTAPGGAQYTYAPLQASASYTGPTEPVGDEKTPPGSLSCMGVGTIQPLETYGASAVVVYRMISIAGVQYVIDTATQTRYIGKATVGFTLVVGQRQNCTGSFIYNRDTVDPILATYELTVSDPAPGGKTTTTPIKIAFKAPPNANPDTQGKFVLDPNSTEITKQLVAIAIENPITNSVGFDFTLQYFDGFGLRALAGKEIICSLGDATLRLMTDGTGRVELRGALIARQDREKSWIMTTSLTGDTVVFKADPGQPIGKVSCTTASEDGTYTRDLGSW